MSKSIQAVLILSGMIIGVGIFGIPFSFARAGFLLGVAELIVLTGFVLLFHLLYADVVLADTGFHRLPGYVKKYLGVRVSYCAWVSACFGIVGTLVAYIVLGSFFLTAIFQEAGFAGAQGMWAFLIVGVGSIVTFVPVRKGVVINGILTVLLMAFILVLVVFLLPYISLEHFSGVHPKHVVLPYGILLFALSGGIIIPDIIAFLGRRKNEIRRVIVAGTIIPAIFYFLFAVAVIGVAGIAVSPDAISGLEHIAGMRTIVLGNVIGFLAVMTSYILLLISFQALLRLDFFLPSFAAWCVASFVPFVFYFLGFQDYLALISLVGAVAVGTDAALVIAMHARLTQDHGMRMIRIGPILRRVMYSMIMLGAIFAAFHKN